MGLRLTSEQADQVANFLLPFLFVGHGIHDGFADKAHQSIADALGRHLDRSFRHAQLLADIAIGRGGIIVKYDRFQGSVKILLFIAGAFLFERFETVIQYRFGPRPIILQIRTGSV